MIETELISEIGINIVELNRNGMNDFGWKIVLLISTLLIGIIAPLVALMATEKGICAIGFVILVIPIVLMIQITGDQETVNNEVIELKQERIDLYEGQIKSASCEDLRLHIIDVIENDYTYRYNGDSRFYVDKYIEDQNQWVQDLYYHKCEVPLRDEVLKLQ